jgi:predicted P-loop ATPase
LIKRHYWFDPGEKNTRDAAVQLCLENSFNPVVDYLARLQWDGRERIARWVVTYLGAPETPLACAIGRLMLIAAVRRARRPGVKFDQIIVLEGPEGTGKSSALRILAGDDNFSDQAVLGVSDKEQQEAIMGVWIHEIAELAGMRRTEVERIKAFASRTEDRARPAYGRFRVDMRRRGIFVATTNADAYLKSDTGDRRFWPLATTIIDLVGLEHDRDQLWAEAAMCEARGDSLVLDRKLWSEAREAQRARQEVDPWYDTIRAHILSKNVEDTSITEVLEGIMRMQTREYGQIEQNRAARVMQHLGYERYRKRDGDSLSWRYRPRGAGTGGTVGT